MKLKLEDMAEFNHKVAKRLNAIVEIDDKGLEIEDEDYFALTKACKEALNDLDETMKECFQRKAVIEQAVEIATLAFLLYLKTLSD